MLIQMVSVGNHMPAWVTAGFDEYARRMPHECSLKLREITSGKRTRNADVARIIEDEGMRMLQGIPSDHHVVALDLAGKEWDTPQFSGVLSRWMRDGRDVSLLIGGPEGLSQACQQRAKESWRLSALTFPHPMVRVIVAEQLYRAWSLLHNHPYHRP